MIRQNLHDTLLRRVKEPRRFLQVLGGQGIPLEEFLAKPAAHWVQ